MRDRRQRVDDLPDTLRMVEPEALAELDRDAADREEAGRRVVAPRARREARRRATSPSAYSIASTAS